MSMVLLHSRDVQHARATRQDKASAFRRRKDRAEYGRFFEEVAAFTAQPQIGRFDGRHADIGDAR